MNFNGLNTRDIESAKRFYGVGVRLADDVPGGSAPRCGRCRPTATTSSADNPGLREGDAAEGTAGVRRRRSEHQTRFARIRPIRQPHWSVTFGVDDVDATPRRRMSSADR